jgi:integrase/recombinase XerD
MVPRKARKLPDVLTEQEQVALLNQPNPRYPTGSRNRAILAAMLGAGLRSEEAVNLRIGDLDWMTGKLHLKRGKGAKDRILWLNPEALEILRKWREKRAALLGSDGRMERLFCTLKGEALQTSYLRQAVPRIAAKAGIEKRVHPHLLRHTFGTWLYKQTGNLRLVQEALGHSDISTTQIYTHLVNRDLEEATIGYRIGGTSEVKE